MYATNTILMDVRKKLHKTQSQFAELLDIHQSAIARLENHSTELKFSTLEKYLHKLNLQACIQQKTSTKTLIGDLQELHIYLDEGDENFAFRFICQCISDFRKLAEEDKISYLQGAAADLNSCIENTTLTHTRYSILLIGVLYREARAATLPPSTYDHVSATNFVLPQWWIVTPYEGLWAWHVANADPELRIRNIFLDPNELESV